jgi:hypothetical protein
MNNEKVQEKKMKSLDFKELNKFYIYLINY